MSTTQSKYDLSAISEEQLKMLQVWRTKAVDLAPFYATILFSLRPVAAKIGTMGVDQNLRLYIDFDEVSTWGDDSVAQVLLHECGHVIGDHSELARELGLHSSSQTAKMFNIAADMAINDDLAELGHEYISETGMLPQHVGQPDHLTPMEYYAALHSILEQQAEPGESQESDTGGQQGEGQSDSGQSEPGRPGRPDLGELAKTCGSVAHGAPLPWELDEVENLGGEAKPASKTEVDRIVEIARTELEDWAKPRPGSLTLGQIGRLSGKGQSTVHWTRRLAPLLSRAALSSRRGSHTSYRRTSRRFRPQMGGRSVVLPGRVSPKVNVGCLIDSSMSTTVYQRNGQIVREVDAIHKKVVNHRGKTFIIDADTEIHDVREYTGRSSLRTIRGLGGTDMRSTILTALADPRLTRGSGRLDALVVITDGETDYPQKADLDGLPRIPVIVCLISPDGRTPREFPVPDWMQVVNIPAALL